MVGSLTVGNRSINFVSAGNDTVNVIYWGRYVVYIYAGYILIDSLGNNLLDSNGNQLMSI